MNAPLSRTLELHDLDFDRALRQAREAIEAIPPGGALSILTDDKSLDGPLRDMCGKEGFDFSDVSEPATQCFIIYRQF